MCWKEKSFRNVNPTPVVGTNERKKCSCFNLCTALLTSIATVKLFEEEGISCNRLTLSDLSCAVAVGRSCSSLRRSSSGRESGSERWNGHGVV
ncbi:hypothetical protein TcWFU_008412 [Taenia crassiceps]|uniref:Uncharacterized protein n=1 Tax=Taenia crassiceps TaxID=6207 RepID=A0ABR4QCK1_9CEST